MDQPPTVQSEGQTPPNAMTSSKEHLLAEGKESSRLLHRKVTIGLLWGDEAIWQCPRADPMLEGFP